MSAALSGADSRVLAQRKEGCVFMLAVVCVRAREILDCLGMSPLLILPSLRSLEHVHSKSGSAVRPYDLFMGSRGSAVSILATAALARVADASAYDDHVLKASHHYQNECFCL